jgi:HSP20 family protein
MCAMSLMPFNRGRSVSRRRPAEADPLLALRQEMSQVFDDFFSGVGLPSFAGSEPGSTVTAILTPRMDVSETDDAVQIAVELPGLDEGDVTVTLDSDVLTIRGEKATERDEDERDYHIIERAEGTFLRTLRLPFEADPEQVQAAFQDGVLTITIPKPKQAQQKSRRIEVHGQNGSSNGSAGSRERSGVDLAAAGDKPASADTSAAGDRATSGDKSSGGAAAAGAQQGSASGTAQTAADRK